MKKILLITLVLVISLSLTGAAMARARGPKVAPLTCLSWTMGSFKTVLSIKPWSGNIAVFGEKIKYYAIHGELSNGFDFSAPLTGTGHLDGNIFHFSLISVGQYAGFLDTVHFEGYWDVVSQTGNGMYNITYTDDSSTVRGGYRPNMELAPSDCSQIPIVESLKTGFGGNNLLSDQLP